MNTLKKTLTLTCIVVLLGMLFGSTPAQAQTFAYVTNQSSNNVSVIATASNTVVATVAVGSSAANVAITPDGAFAYVTNQGSNTVSVIATASNTVVATVAVGSGPIGVAITPDGAFAYVANFNSNTVSVIATASDTVVATVRVGANPFGVAITPDGAFAYVTNISSNTVSVIATASNMVVATVAVGAVPRGLAITPDGALAYVTNQSSNNVSVIATASNMVVATVAVGFNPRGVAITPDGAFAYVTNFSSGTVSVIATASNMVVATVAVGSNPFGVAITPEPTNQPPDADAGSDQVICDGGSVQIGGSPTGSGGNGGPYTFSWSPTTGLDDPTLANPTASPAATTMYTVMVTETSTGLTDMDAMTVTANPNIVADAGPDVTLVIGGSTAIGSAPTAAGGTPPFTFSWLPTTGLNDPTLANPIAMPTDTTTYTVTVTDAIGCTATDSMIVNVLPLVSVTLTPTSPPVTIPAAGGTFQYVLTVTNNTASPQTFDRWNMITLPNGEDVGPTVGPINGTLGSGQSITQTEPQNVPGAPAPGMYTYTFNIGTFPSVIDASDSFTFTKLAETDDWGDAVTAEKTAAVPEEFVLQQNYPNPFNPSTTITFGVPEASEVRLAIYNLGGQLIQILHSGFIAAGQHSVVWDGNDFRGAKVASGVYVYRLESKEFVLSKKLVFMK